MTWATSLKLRSFLFAHIHSATKLFVNSIYECSSRPLAVHSWCIKWSDHYIILNTYYLSISSHLFTIMAPALYLLHVNSRPNHVSNKLWEEWYIAEHLPDLVNSKTSIRATFYEEIPTPASPTLSHPRKFLALYQTDFPESLETRNYKDLRTTSELFKKEDAGDGIAENGDFDARNYKLIQAYDPREIGESKCPRSTCAFSTMLTIISTIS